MKIDAFIFQIILLFLPGVVWARLDVAWARKSKPSDIEFFVLSFLYGIASYAITYGIYTLFGANFELINIDKPALFTGAVVKEVLIATVVSFICGLLWLYASNYKITARFLQYINATKRFGDEDVWDFTFNSRSKSVVYVHWRDFDQKLVYAGYVNTFSESGEVREIVMRDVTVYDFEGNKQYDVPMLYLAKKSDSIHIEFPIQNVETSGNDDRS
ncbi:hypothetical protein IPV08_23455 [Methylobacterium sp. SD274]|uniref:DUF6338 family protein n=1 Tax=Methylobacterium sp. SD274 TaxID=2782009 RepID=UPI001A9691DD|nr:hypothetical protein [Methylobacterium sp. SD274]